ncbi:MAG: 8-oxoguanine DNA glycosylase domain protein [Candidatus Amesbacteria bacterium GW2011_GWB1_47_26]|nr:MAG: 8-oxoguanine DNA glycosylase domain protein [Candidatus Amesbacteria bacterium GW2011_GWB1_47_26]
MTNAKRLHRVIREKIVPTTPFNFDATFHKPAHFSSGDNFWEPGIRWQTFRWAKQDLGVIFKSIGTVKQPKIAIRIYSQEKLTADFVNNFVKEIVYRYHLDLDLTPFYKEFSEDKVLGPVIRKMNGMRPGHQDSLYEYLIIGIVLQNCTVRRSIQMMQVLFEKCGTLLEFAGQKLWCFWEPGRLKTVTEEELRALKVGYRAKFIKKIDEQFANGLIDEFELRKKDLQTQRSELLKLYGIGPATVWYLLFDVFHHWDFFDHVSPWEQKIYSKVFFDKDPENPVPVEKLLKHFEKFGK